MSDLYDEINLITREQSFSAISDYNNFFIWKNVFFRVYG